jgi:hypothetical protein
MIASARAFPSPCLKNHVRKEIARRRHKRRFKFTGHRHVLLAAWRRIYDGTLA